MTTMLTAAPVASDLLALLSKGSLSAAPASVPAENGDFATQLLDAQAAGASPTAAGTLPSATDPALSTDLAEVLPTAGDATASAGATLPISTPVTQPVETRVDPTVGLSDPTISQTADATVPKPSPSAIPTQSPVALSLPTTTESAPLVVSATPPNLADTTITSPSQGRHSGSHRPATDAPVSQLPLLTQLPSPVAAAMMAPVPAAPVDRPAAPESDADSSGVDPSGPGANAIGAIAAADVASASAALSSTPGAVAPPTVAAPAALGVGEGAAPKPVAARAHLSASAPTTSSWLANAAGHDAPALAPAVPAIGSQAWSVDRNPKDQSDTTTATASGAASVEGAATVAPAAPLATAASAAPAAAPSPTPLLDQMTRPIFTLRSAAPGTHVMTIHVAPEAIGPVTVRAHIDGGDIRVQVIAPNDESTAALTAILPDLKRDLAQGGMNAALTLHQHTGDFGSDFGNSSGQNARDLFGGSTSQPGGGGPRDQSSPLRLPGDIAQPAASTQAQPRPRTADTSIDVLA